jgi:hypothetical protein
MRRGVTAGHVLKKKKCTLDKYYVVYVSKLSDLQIVHYSDHGINIRQKLSSPNAQREVFMANECWTKKTEALFLGGPSFRYYLKTSANWNFETDRV